ncbi:hypothetical protein HYY70_04690, partial [Candidatus Woesearchaeota archaeon]|nr:hypothetical protein [Candidatus Woesearchaeota archaeon]
WLDTSHCIRTKLDPNLPILKHIEFPSRFKFNQNMPISVEFENNSIIRNISMSYKTDRMRSWSSLGNYVNRSFANSTLRITSAAPKEIDFKFSAYTSDGISTYEIYPVSLKTNEVFCTQRQRYDRDLNKTIVNGRCTDERNKPVKGIRLELYVGSRYLGAVMTESNQFENPEGSYEIQLDGRVIGRIDIKFEGTGVYGNSRFRLR